MSIDTSASREVDTTTQWPLASVTDLDAAVRRAAVLWRDQPAWVFDPGERLTFGDIDARVDGVAAALWDRGVRPGDRVGLRLGNRAEFPLTWLGCARIGATAVPINPRYRSTDLAHVLAVAPLRLLVTDGPLPTGLPAVTLASVDELRATSRSTRAGSFPAVDSKTDQAVNVQFTSGTTGRPKACLLGHDYWLTLGRSLIEEFPRLGETDVMLTAQPFTYVDPQWNVVASLLSGARLVVLDGFHPSTFWDRVREHGVTYFYCLAAMPTLLLAQQPSAVDREHQVRAVQCSAIPPALHVAIEQRWGTPWYEAFGMTETGADLRVTDRDHDELLGSGCVGAPAAHREARVVTTDGSVAGTGVTGELQLRGPGMFGGYLGDPDATAAAMTEGWFRTGDLARLDAAGRVYLVGRTKDMIRRSGENVAAREVEDVLATHPSVRLVAVVAVPDDLRGEEVKAVVVTASEAAPAPGAATRLATELAAWASDRLARFKVPRYWEFRAELPLTPSQRVAKTELGPATGPVVDLAVPRMPS